MNILFLDTETTGLPMDWKAPVTQVDNWPRCFQLAFQVANDTGEVLYLFKSLITPDGWEVPQQDFWINNGHSTEKCIAEGIPMTEALQKLIDCVDEFDIQLLVAHNMDFDKNIVGAEMIRYEKRLSRKLPKICTMQKSTQLCAIPGRFGFKFPKLEELHRFLFAKDFDGAHDAGSDVSACRVCFFELLKRDIISLPQIPIQ